MEKRCACPVVDASRPFRRLLDEGLHLLSIYRGSHPLAIAAVNTGLALHRIPVTMLIIYEDKLPPSIDPCPAPVN